MRESLVRVANMTKTFPHAGDAVVALDRVSLDVTAREAIAITGPSGSGKTTLLNLVGGLDRPSGGTVRVGGRDLTAMRSDELAAYRCETVGFVFQAFRLLPYLTALENVALPMLLAGVARRDAIERAREGLDRVGLASRASHRPAELSAGEQQRVAAARAVANKPQLLLADEPTGNLDDASSRAVLELFTELRERDGLTVIVATHNAEVAARCEREIRLRGGRVVETVAR